MREKQRENSPGAARAQVANAGTNAQKQLKRELDFWTCGGIPSHDTIRYVWHAANEKVYIEPYS